MHLQEEELVASLEPSKVLQHMECTFVFAAVWSLGGTVATNKDRVAFQTFFRAALNCNLHEYVGPSGERWVGDKST